MRGAYIILVDIPQGWGNYRFLCSNNGNSREEGGDFNEIPSVVGVGIFSGTRHKFLFCYLFNINFMNAIICRALTPDMSPREPNVQYMRR